MSGHAQRGHFERRCDLDCITREEACPHPDCPAPITASVLPSPDQHPSWCKYQRVCGGDQ